MLHHTIYILLTFIDVLYVHLTSPTHRCLPRFFSSFQISWRISCVHESSHRYNLKTIFWKTRTFKSLESNSINFLVPIVPLSPNMLFHSWFSIAQLTFRRDVDFDQSLALFGLYLFRNFKRPKDFDLQKMYYLCFLISNFKVIHHSIQVPNG